ncbi:Transient receptor potential cation channel subfamily A member 1 [Trichoplax sp. H2]|nr:Transient receptor potential cation channel subfamily A member 1 [Trichoplax sp. H2]|eukprot:RDD41723.1 Transient receptor potential cation channel subfamily A member 1 [Trichoplax sp. H2]
MKKRSRIHALYRKNDDHPNVHGVRFWDKWKFPSWGSKENINRSSTIENGIDGMFINAKEQLKRPKSVTDCTVNNSLVSLGFAVANTKTWDLYQAIKKGSLEEIRNLVTLNYYHDKINSLDKENLFTFMHYAARYNRSDVIGCLIDFGADVNSMGGKDSIAPLHVAAQHNCTEAAQSLIRFGATVHVNSKTKNSPLHYCCKYGSDGVAEIILKETERLNITGKIINHPDNESYYPIHFAALYNNKAMIDILLKFGASIVKKNVNGRLPSHFAAEHKDTAVLEDLLQCAKVKGLNDYIIISNNEGGTALHIAADVGSIIAAEICLKYGAEIEAQTYELLTPLHIAAKNGNYEFAEFLISRGAKVNSKDDAGRTCLHYAALSNSISITELIIRKGADIEDRDTGGHTPLHLAVKKGCTQVIKKLFELGADITTTDSDGRHCVHYIAEQTDISTIQAVLENGGKELVECPDNEGLVPLRMVATEGNLPALYFLVQNGASMGTLDKEGNTLLHIAAKANHRDTIKQILKHTNAKDINTRNTSGQKPIHIAAIYGHKRVIQNMIKNGADINSKDIHSYYPLHYVAKDGYTAAAQLLVDENAKIDVLDRSDNTPIHLACANGHQEVTKILLASGADPTTINNQGLNCLDLAIENDQTEIGLQIIRSKYWEKALENKEFDGHTPMKRLIEKLPIVAYVTQAVMDRCITYTSDIGDSKEKQIVFNFSYLEAPPSKTKTKNTEDNYSAASSILSHNRIKLMQHPLIRAYRHYKWNSLLRYHYYGRCFINLVFLLAVCTPVSLNINNYYKAVRNQTGNNAVEQITVTQPSKFMNEIAASIVEIGIELMALLYCLPFQQPTTILKVQIGAMIVFLSFINFLRQLKRAFGVGLYLTMFLTIMKTIIRASLVIILFLIAFAIACHMVLRQLPEFSELGYAFIRVLTMMVGDISYREIFQHLYDTNQLQNSGLALIIIVLSVVIINIAFANLLVGLAVGDINEVRSNADISLIQMDLSYISSLRTYFMPKFLQKYAYQSALVLRNHHKMKLREKFIWKKLTEGVRLQAPIENTLERCKDINIFQELRQQNLNSKDFTDNFADFRSDVLHHLITIESLLKKISNEDPALI